MRRQRRCLLGRRRLRALHVGPLQAENRNFSATRSIYGRDQAELLYGPDDLDGPGSAAAGADAKAAQDCTRQLRGLRRRLLPQCWHEVRRAG